MPAHREVGTAVAPEVVVGSGPLVEPLPFSTAEYERRLAAVRLDMAATGLDAFVAFGPENINYLTGHDTPAYQYLQACLVTHDGLPTNVLRSIDASNTLLRSWSRRAVAYADHDDPVETLRTSIRELVPRGARIGAEDGAFFVTPRRYARLADALAADGYRLVGSRLVDERRLSKSAEELAVIRSAGRITARAMQAAIDTAAEGVDENAIAAAVWASLVQAGGEFPGLPPFIVSGPRSSLGHATWSGRRLARGDALNFEIPGVVARYVAPLFRTGSVGRPSPDMRAVEAACLASLDLLLAAIRPGVCIADLHRINVDNFARRGLTIGHRTGYSVGVNYAPDWGEGATLSIVDGETRELRAGMVFHLVPGLYVPGRMAVVISETVAVAEQGAERIIDLPRPIFVV
jgi:Xaa-Pro dipeptidase